ncbi:hypothetical protein BJX70DRAFT_400941 [Aspergillus crustosus]
MSSRPKPEEPPARRKMREALRALHNSLASLKIDQVDFPTCARLQICISSMSLDEESDSKPTFFAFYSSPALQLPTENYDRERDLEYPTYDPDEPLHWRTPLSCSGALVDYFRSYLASVHSSPGYVVHDETWSLASLGEQPWVGLDRYQQPEHQTIMLQQDKKMSLPHLKATFYCDHVGADDRLLHGELLVIFRLMITQLRRTVIFQHVVAPILLFSFMGVQHARVIEAYFNGTQLVVRLTKLHDLRTKDAQAFMAFGQLYFGKAIGSTRALPTS